MKLNKSSGNQVKKKLNLPFLPKDILDILSGGYKPFKTEKQYPTFNKNNFFNITEGELYSHQEQTGYRKNFGKLMSEHDAVDIHLPYGTPIYAPCDIYVMSSYQSTAPVHKQTMKYAIGKDGQVMKWGLGLFVQGYIPGSDIFVQLGHLSQIYDDIPFTAPTQGHLAGDNIPTDCSQEVLSIMSDRSPNGHNTPFDHTQIPESSHYKYIKKGTLLGYSGISGLTMGYEEYNPDDPRKIIKPSNTQIYDEPHLHFEIFQRNEKGAKHHRIQPTIKDEFGNYQLNPDVFGS